MKQRCNPIKTALVLAGSATLTIGSLAQPDSAAVTAALRTPVLGQVGNHSYEVISLLVRHADKAADQSWSLLDSPAALAAHQKDLRDVCNKCGPQDAEQNFFGQLAFGLNHAGYLLARAPSPVCMNCTHGDFFPFAGSRKSLAVASELFGRFGWGERMAMMDVPGPHGWQEGTRGASIQWMQRRRWCWTPPANPIAWPRWSVVSRPDARSWLPI